MHSDARNCWASPSRADDPAAYSRVSFDIAPYDGMVRLTVTHDELEAGSGMAKGIQQGWPIVLSSLKSLLETKLRNRPVLLDNPHVPAVTAGARRAAAKLEMASIYPAPVLFCSVQLPAQPLP